ncbi:MAG: HAD family hydrolase [Dysgonamonadaceae bacterium]|jgi:phosphoglycolate phosphatase|nr:HAD family hydrolase [Dysgonamonadaceae bacterium]
MKNYQAIIFDLDGTLIDSLEDIADAMNLTLASFGFPTHNYDAYRYFVGNGLMNLVRVSVPQSTLENQQLLQLCFEAMIDKYQKCLLNKTRLYSGVKELLDILNSKKLKMAVLSNKADKLTQQICNALLKDWSFNVVMGSTEDFPRKPHPDSALFIAKKLNISPENIIYMGDTNIDIKTANAAGMFPVGVTWGFRTREELQEAGAKLIIDKPSELFRFLTAFGMTP